MGKTWAKHGQNMGKTWAKHGQNMGKSSIGFRKYL
jgi:hypothetical protein